MEWWSMDQIIRISCSLKFWTRLITCTYTTPSYIGTSSDNSSSSVPLVSQDLSNRSAVNPVIYECKSLSRSWKNLLKCLTVQRWSCLGRHRRNGDRKTISMCVFPLGVLVPWHFNIRMEYCHWNGTGIWSRIYSLSDKRANTVIW